MQILLVKKFLQGVLVFFSGGTPWRTGGGVQKIRANSFPYPPPALPCHLKHIPQGQHNNGGEDINPFFVCRPVLYCKLCARVAWHNTAPLCAPTPGSLACLCVLVFGEVCCPIAFCFWHSDMLSLTKDRMVESVVVCFWEHNAQTSTPSTPSSCMAVTWYSVGQGHFGLKRCSACAWCALRGLTFSQCVP